MPKFRKKPVVVEAVQTVDRVEIETLEGTMVAEPWDWIITGVAGERYPCKPDIFRRTYELVGPDATRTDTERLDAVICGGVQASLVEPKDRPSFWYSNVRPSNEYATYRAAIDAAMDADAKREEV